MHPRDGLLSCLCIVNLHNTNSNSPLLQLSGGSLVPRPMSPEAAADMFPVSMHRSISNLPCSRAKAGWTSAGMLKAPLECGLTQYFVMQGLGKTITGLAVMLKTLGLRPNSPMGPDGSPLDTKWVTDSMGRPAAYYSGGPAGAACTLLIRGYP